MTRLPPTVATICAARAWAPRSTASPPELIVSRLPATTRVLVQLLSWPRPLLVLPPAPTLMAKPFWLPPTAKPTPMLALRLVPSFFWLDVFCWAVSRMSPWAFSNTLRPAVRFEPETVMLDWAPLPAAMMIRSRFAVTADPLAVRLSPVRVWLELLAPTSTLTLMPPICAGFLATAS
ncbi:hypothetical protein LMG3412_06483 [Achromobacter deleyi]|nr:hypothetical protein LMG3412_06483 [Achromobacter deleyi]